MIEVSVVVPVYKVEKYLRRCVDSLLNQDYGNYEIILVDDGSPDNCPVICDEYDLKEKIIRVIHKENGGLSDARNVGVNNAKGKYIIFVDSDDYVERNHISSLYSLIEKYNADIVCSPPIIEYEKYSNTDYEVNVENSRQSLFKSFVVSSKDAQEMILRGNPVGTSAWSKIIKKDYCIKHPFPKGKVMEELATTFYLIGEAKRIAVTGVPSYHYVQRNGSILRSKFTLEEIEEYMSLAENYVTSASTKDIKLAAVSRIFLLARRLGCSIPEDREKKAYCIINKFCKRYFVLCILDRKSSLKEKIRAFLMSISPITLKILIQKIQCKEKKRFRDL